MALQESRFLLHIDWWSFYLPCVERYNASSVIKRKASRSMQGQVASTHGEPYLWTMLLTILFIAIKRNYIKTFRNFITVKASRDNC